MNRPIGVFDSGFGGLTVLRELRKALPEERFIYLGDNARAPYGTKGDAVIRRYAHECAQFLLTHEVKMIIVACNTASAVALAELEQGLPVPVIGTIAPAVKSALTATQSKSVAIIGTDATIASNAYQKAINEADPSIKITAFSCPLFVPLVECGMIEGEIVEMTVRHYLGRLQGSEVDSLILGCTHYPLLKEAISRFLGKGVKVIECSEAIASDVSQLSSGPGKHADADDLFFTTDDVGRFNFLANYFLASEGLRSQRAALNEAA